jgi:transportin-1
MAQPQAFVPDPAALNQVLAMLRYALAPDTAAQKQATSALESNSANPLFLAYLAHVFVRHAVDGVQVQQMAGLALKRGIDAKWGDRGASPSLLDAGTRAQVQASLLEGLAHPEPLLRSTAANAIAAVVRKGGLAGLSALPGHLCGALDSQSAPAQAGALTALSLLAEDTASEWEDPGLGRPIAHVVPRLVRWMQAPREGDRQMAAQAMLEFVRGLDGRIPGEAWPDYFRVLAALTSDPALRMRVVVLRSFAEVVRCKWDLAMPNLQAIVSFVLSSLGDGDEAVAKAACEFWPLLLEACRKADDAFNSANRHGTGAYDDRHSNALFAFVPAAVAALSSRMVWTDEMLAELPAEVLNASAATRAEDVRPHMFHGKGAVAGSGEGPEDEGSDDDDDGEGPDHSDPHAEVKAYNVREMAAHAFDSLALHYNGRLLPSLLPHLNALLSGATDPVRGWRQRELVVFTLGAVSDGCLDDMSEHLDKLYPYLLSLLRDPHPLVRSMAIWCLGKYSRWIIERENESDGSADVPYLASLVEGVCACLADANPRVQQYACTALYNMSDEAQDMLSPYGDVIIAAIIAAFPVYRETSRDLLYDALAHVIEIGALQEQLLDRDKAGALVSQLGARLATLPPGKIVREGVALLECLSRVGPAMGVDFAPACPSLLAMSVQYLQLDLVDALGAHAAGERIHDCAATCAALDMVTAIAEAVRDAVGDLLGPSRLLDIVASALPLPVSDVQQSIFVLVGTLAEFPSLWPYIAPHAGAFAQGAMTVLSSFASHAGTRLNVVNNAVWALGKIAIRVGPAFAPAVPALLPVLCKVISSTNTNRTLLQNVSFALGIIAETCTAAVVNSDAGPDASGSSSSAAAAAASLRWPGFLLHWIRAISIMREQGEREQALRGLCHAVRAAPGGLSPQSVNHLAMCFAASFEPAPPPTLLPLMQAVLQGLKQAAGPQGWGSITAEWNANLKQRMATVFGAGP